MYDASDPPAIVRFMTKTGYKAELSADANGDPVITGRISRSDYTIQFYECERNTFCNSIQFFVQAPRPAGFGLEQANAFNARWRYVRVTLAGDVVRLQMDVNLDAGVTGDNLEDTLDIWRQLLETFEREVLKSG
ncbi:MAG: YbjN domain-containing protein [Alphaproteobacteria bacterium]|nr:YbjN domain-containing protein [Alphaproteobacteria bacterium]